MTVSTTNFSDRLARIERTRASHAGSFALHVGEAEVYVKSLEALRPREGGARRLMRNALYPLSFVMAFGLGALALPISTAIRARLVPFPAAAEAPTGDAPLILAMVLGMMVSFVLTQAFRLRAKELTLAQSAGVWAALCLMHNLAFWLPDLSAMLFTPEWVALQTQIAQPDTFMFRGLIFAI